MKKQLISQRNCVNPPKGLISRKLKKIVIDLVQKPLPTVDRICLTRNAEEVTKSLGWISSLTMQIKHSGSSFEKTECHFGSDHILQVAQFDPSIDGCDNVKSRGDERTTQFSQQLVLCYRNWSGFYPATACYFEYVTVFRSSLQQQGTTHMTNNIF